MVRWIVYVLSMVSAANSSSPMRELKEKLFMAFTTDIHPVASRPKRYIAPGQGKLVAYRSN